MKKLISLLIVIAFAASALPAGAAPEKLKLSNPMVAAADTGKAKVAKTDVKKAKKAKKAKTKKAAKKNKAELGAKKPA